MFGLFKKQRSNIYELPFGEKSEAEIRKLAESLAGHIRTIVQEEVPGSKREHSGRAALLIEGAAFDISSSMFDRIKIWNAVENIDRDAYHHLIAAFQDQGRRNGLIASII